jgi:signal transduction histidine kinase
MYTIRRKIGIILVVCSVAAVLLSALFVNITISRTFNKYMSDIQDKRYDRIVKYFEEVYKTEGKFTSGSGTEIMHEAYMNNYCLTLFDENRKMIWTMNPESIRPNSHMMMNMPGSGVYTTKTFEITSGARVVGYIDIGQFSPVLLSEEDIDFKLSINKSIVLSVIVTILIAILTGIYISKQFSSPITRVSDTSVHLSKGNYDARSDTTSDIVEISNLTESINILGEKLKKQDEIRKRLVSDIAHEIRAPLNILQNNLEAMIDGVFEVTGERLVSLNEEVIRFGKLLDNLYVLKEFESKDAVMNMEPVKLDELVSSIAEGFSLELGSKNMRLAFNSNPREDYTVMGDLNSLKQVFINLLSNAVKFTPEGGSITIDLGSRDNQIICSIRDTGTGISDEDLPFIFERLYRGDKSRNMTEGSGIGLTIVRKILMLHSAVIDVESKEGKGTTFTVRFKKVHYD